jgi:hypothetical protein
MGVQPAKSASTMRLLAERLPPPERGQNIVFPLWLTLPLKQAQGRIDSPTSETFVHIIPPLDESVCSQI